MTAAVDHPTRIALLTAGTTLAARDGLHGVSVNNIVTEAQLAKGTFYVHFTDRADYLVALHRDFHDRLFASVARTTRTMECGAARLRRTTEAYLDGCLAESATRAILFDAHSEPLVRAEVERRNRTAVAEIAKDLKAMKRSPVAETARLVIALTVDVALAEHEAGQRLPTLRRAMRNLILI
jgi:TetR/AcrR family transcriptional regulator, transcriptional repressor for nem operon